MLFKKVPLVKNEKQILIILSHNETVQQECFAELGEKAVLWKNKESGFHNILVYMGTMEEWLRCFKAEDLELCRKMLSGVVLEWNNKENDWESYRCQPALMYCCAGAYLRIVNRKEIVL